MNAPDRIAAPPGPGATLELDLMRAMVAIAEAGGVSAAAERLGRSPAAISMQLKRLEDGLGRLLFDRARSGMIPTVDGERLLPHARAMLAAERAALDAFRGPALAGELRIGINDDVATERLAQVLGHFARSHPEVTVTVAAGTSSSLAPRLAAGELDLAVLTPGDSVQWEPGDRALHGEALVWIARCDGTAHLRRPLPLAVASRGCAWRASALAALDRAGLPWRIAYNADVHEGQKAAVMADLAIAPVPRSRAGPGFRVLRAEDGFPEIGEARVALRLAADPACCARALAARIAESYGASCDLPMGGV